MSKRSGFTLIEVLLSLGLLSIVIVSTFSYLYTVKQAEQVDKTVTDLNIIVQNQMELVMAAETVTELYSIMTANFVYSNDTSFQNWIDNPNSRSVGTEYEYAIGGYKIPDSGSDSQNTLYQVAVIARSVEDNSRRVLLITIKNLEEL